jgi:hypothetical protein
VALHSELFPNCKSITQLPCLQSFSNFSLSIEENRNALASAHCLLFSGPWVALLCQVNSLHPFLALQPLQLLFLRRTGLSQVYVLLIGHLACLQCPLFLTSSTSHRSQLHSTVTPSLMFSSPSQQKLLCF